MPDRRSILRLLALAGFLLTVALALWLAEVRPLVVALVMVAGLLVAWTVEWLSWRRDLLRPAGETVDVRDGEVALPLVPPAPTVEPAAPVRAEPEPPPPVQQASTPEPEPVAPPRPELRPVPAPPPPPPRGEEPPRPVRPVAAASGVVDIRTRMTAQPRRWNLWDLERRARDEARRDPLRYEEWSYLFVHLRQFATPDGSLPLEFDGLVREAFGELLEHAGS